ncbi:retrovirus-related pol polyprotein from transposon TNT 1-94 [Tanacetum coccineum]
MTNDVPAPPTDPPNTLDGSRVWEIRNSQVKDNNIDLLVQQYEQFTILEEESIDSGFARFNTIITSLKALDEGFSSKNYVRNSHEKDSEIYRGKKERIKSIALKAKKESSDDETSTSKSDDEEYAMAVRNFKKFFRRKGMPWTMLGKWRMEQRCGLLKHMTRNKSLFSTLQRIRRGRTRRYLAFNLLSVGEICDNNCQVLFTEEEEAIKKNTKVVNNNNEEDESIEVDKIVNIKESKNHSLDQVIGNLSQRTLRSQAQNHTMQEELNQLVANDVWELVLLPISQSVIGTKWVFRNKLDENGIVSRNKARLVAQGYNQQEGIDYDETYAPVARLESIRILLAIACANDFKLYQMDVKSTFLNGFINEEVYVAQPPGFIDFQKPNYVYKLKKALYGLKQALKAWYDKLKAFLIKHEYSIGIVDNTLFTKKSKSHLIIVQIYVDDIIFGSTIQNLCDDFSKIMHDEFEMSMMGELNFFLGLQIKQMEDRIFFNQSKYIKEMLKKFRLEDSKPNLDAMSRDQLTKAEADRG